MALELTTDQIRSQYFNSFSNGVMTMVSIVSGIALYFNITSLYALAKHDFYKLCSWDLQHQFLFLKAGFVFLLIVGLFHMYHYTTPIIFGSPTYMSSLSLFATGASLSLLAVSVAGPDGDTKNARHDLFCISLVAFYFSCLAAFALTYYRAHRTPSFEKRIKSDAKRNIAIFTVLAAASIAYLKLTETAADKATGYDIAFLLFNALLLGAGQIATFVCLLLHIKKNL